MVDFRHRSYIWSCLLWCSRSRKATRCLNIFAHSRVPPPTTVSHALLSITPSSIICRQISCLLEYTGSGYSPVVYFPCLAQRRHDMVGLWSLPAASLLLLQIALSLEAPAGGKPFYLLCLLPQRRGEACAFAIS